MYSKPQISKDLMQRQLNIIVLQKNNFFCRIYIISLFFVTSQKTANH